MGNMTLKRVPEVSVPLSALLQISCFPSSQFSNLLDMAEVPDQLHEGTEVDR